jgi:hypothetical protein
MIYLRLCRPALQQKVMNLRHHGGIVGGGGGGLFIVNNPEVGNETLNLTSLYVIAFT